MEVPTLLSIMFCALQSGFMSGRKKSRWEIAVENYNDPLKEEIAEAIEYMKDLKSDQQTYGKPLYKHDL